MPPSNEACQRAWNQVSVASLHKHHVGEQGEQVLGLELLLMLARHHRVVRAFLDVCPSIVCTTTLAKIFPRVRVEGVKQVAEVRQQAEIQNGISSDDLREDDALKLPFANARFDSVVDTGVLHHIRQWPQALAEMSRMTRYGVLFVDNKDIGQGSSNADMHSAVSHVAIVARRAS